MVLEITLLGPPRVRRDGRPVLFETRKATALLAHLALEDRPRPRSALSELLYPGHDPERSRGALRRTLSTLRTGIGPEWIDTVGDDVALRRDPELDLDVERFRSAAAGSSVASLRQAAELFRGDFLEGFSLRDSPDFDDWQVETAEELRTELASVLRRLTAALVGTGEIGDAVRCAQRWSRLDPLHEPAHQELIRLHAWNGDRAAALEQYRSCLRTLNEELGVVPLEETTRLRAQVSDGTLPAPTQVSGPPPIERGGPRSAPGELLLVGREREQASLVEVHAAARPDGRVAVIEGEAGIGKSRLADELVSYVEAAGGVVLTARCHEDEAALPYGAVVELLRSALRCAEGRQWHTTLAAQHLADAALLLPALGDLVEDGAELLPLGGPGAQVRLAESVAAVLRAALAGPTPGVLLLDDAHAADDATLDAVAYLCRRLDGCALVVVLTWRTERVLVGHRLRRLVAEMSQQTRVRVITPRRLDETEVGDLVRSVVGPEASSEELARRVFRESEGLPLFVAECLASPPEPLGSQLNAAPRVPGVLDARVAGLSETARQVLGAAAAIGRSFDPGTLRRASGRSEEETAVALEELVAHGWVREASGGEGYDFSHQKLRELVYESIPLARRQLLHRRIAAAWASPRTDSAQAVLVAQHLQLAGDGVRAAEEYRSAAEHATSLYAHAEALDHLQAALALGHPDRVGLHQQVGDLRTLVGDYSGALAAYDAAAAYADQPDRPGLLAVIDHKIGEILQRRGEWERAETYLLAAIAAATEQQSGLRARAEADLALIALQRSDLAEAKDLASAALRRAVDIEDLSAEAQVHNLLGVTARGEGDLDLARQHLDRSLGLALRLNDAPAEAAALNNLALVRRDAGDHAEARRLTERALELCSRYGDRHREAALENNLADLHHAAGDEDAAMEHLKRAVVLFSEIGADEATRLPEIWKLVSW